MWWSSCELLSLLFLTLSHVVPLFCDSILSLALSVKNTSFYIISLCFPRGALHRFLVPFILTAGGGAERRGGASGLLVCSSDRWSGRWGNRRAGVCLRRAAIRADVDVWAPAEPPFLHRVKAALQCVCCFSSLGSTDFCSVLACFTGTLCNRPFSLLQPRDRA